MKALVTAGAVVCALSLATTATAQSITTLFAANNGGNLGGAVYFDITVGPDDLTITDYDTNTAEMVPFDWTVYVTAPGGTHVGNEANPGAWSQVATGMGMGMGRDNPSPVALNNTFVLSANTTYGMALVMGAQAGHDYTNGNGPNQNYSNPEVALSLGSATNVPFSGSPFSPRVWNGTIYYEAGPPAPGACCLPDGSCVDGLLLAECEALGGVFQGSNSTCMNVRCAEGACCLPDGTCINGTTLAECEAQGGQYQGPGVICEGEFLGYVIDTCANPFEDIQATGTLGPDGDDNGEVVPIGFDFEFYGVTHTDIGMGTNGYLSFGPDLTDFSNDPIPTPTDPNDLIAPLWDDLVVDFAAGRFTHYETLGTAPDRRFVAQWTNVRQFGMQDSNTFQAILFEGSNCIEFRYGPITPEASPGDYTIGVENPDGTEGESIPGNSVMEGDCRSLCPEFTQPVVCVPPVVEVDVDIKPGSCPNSYNPRSRGVLPAAILGTMTFDVTLIDPTSVEIARADGVGGSVSAIRWDIEDVATPFPGMLCDCHEEEDDGFLDMTLKFDSEELVQAAALKGEPGGSEIEMIISGVLLDGTPIEGSDCIRLVPPTDELEAKPAIED